MRQIKQLQFRVFCNAVHRSACALYFPNEYLAEKDSFTLQTFKDTNNLQTKQINAKYGRFQKMFINVCEVCCLKYQNPVKT